MSAPADPTNLICSRYEDRTGFLLVWDSSVSSGSVAVSYDIEVDKAGNGVYSALKTINDDGLSDRQCAELSDADGIVATQQYFFRIRAVDGVSAPEYSNYVYISGGL